MSVIQPATSMQLNQLPIVSRQAAYAGAILVSVGFFCWLTYRLNRGAGAGMVFWRAAAWIVTATFLAAFLDNIFRAIEIFFVQIWFASFFFFPGFCKRFFRWVNARTGGAPARWCKRIADSAKRRYQTSTLNDWTTNLRSWWNGVPFRKKRLLQIALCVALLVYLIFFEKRSHT